MRSTWLSAAALLFLLSGCGEITPLEAGIDFGIVVLPGTYDDTVALTNGTNDIVTIQSVAWDAGGGSFSLQTDLPLAMDAGAEYPLDFRFTTPSDGSSDPIDLEDRARFTLDDGTTVAVRVTVHWDLGDEDGDGFADIALGGDDCDDTNAAVFPGAIEACNGLDDDCNGAADFENDDGDETDDDGDGSRECDGDCDDNNSAVNPGRLEECDGLDTDCDGILDDSELDGDNDLWTECDGDCGPTNADVHPGAPEICDGLDTDCAAGVPAIEADQDSDGVLVCEDDCDDLDPQVNPNQTEICDGKDTDCDESTEATGGEDDNDGDGSALCDGDCDDNAATVYPFATEFCDGLDNDCDGVPDADADGESDFDLDGSLSCEDCDDLDAANFPGNPEICDGGDNDCDAATVFGGDESDGDLDGAPVCEDCDDANAAVSPDFPEACDGLDTDCDPSTDENADVDGDGQTPCDGDCDDSEATVYPGNIEVCDGLDNDCDAGTEASGGEGDGDSDGSVACEDCDDADAALFPGNPEVCDGQDNDCDGATFADVDGEVDGDGDGSLSCEDCDDDEPANFPGNTEVCDGLDNDCDSGTEFAGGEEDDDEDGSPLCIDCDDFDPLVAPNLPEICDSIDNDCDPSTDENADGDLDGSTVCDGDCDDADPARAPTLTEACDGIDNDCDGELQLGEDFDSDDDGALDCNDSDCPMYVDASFPGSSDGSQLAPWSTLQVGINQIPTNGCTTLWVEAGTYNELLTFPASGEDVRLVALTVATIDGGNAGPIITVEGGQSMDSLVQGFTITNGLATEDGGGVRAIDSGLTLRGNTISGNTTTHEGGGAYLSGGDYLVEDNVFFDNTAVNGGGGLAVINSAPTIRDNTFEGNDATGGDGGGLLTFDTLGDDLLIEGNEFIDNSTGDDGSAMRLGTTQGLVRQNVVFQNDAVDRGTIYIHTTTGQLRVKNNLVVENEAGRGAGIFSFQASPFVDSNTFAYNIADDVQSPSTLRVFEGVVRNNIIAFGTGLGVATSSATTYSYNDVFGFSGNNWEATDLTGTDGNISDDPLFVAYDGNGVWANYDFGLSATSPCIDSGHPSASFTDFDGSPANMGAFGGPEGDW